MNKIGNEGGGGVVYFDQLLGTACTLKQIKILFQHFQAFFLVLHKKSLKQQQKKFLVFSSQLPKAGQLPE